MKTITENEICNFAQALLENELSEATVEKYTAALRKLMNWLDGAPISKERLAAFRDHLHETLAASTVNGDMSAINTWLHYNDMDACRVKLLKLQRRSFCSAKKELSHREYEKLVAAARDIGKEELALIIETICSTGIRVSEVKYITVEAAQTGRTEISLKGKVRTILIPKKLCRKLKEYARKQKIRTGEIFVTKSGKSYSRKRIWAEMKALCKAAGVEPSKVFPHNLRHLFARCFYKAKKDIVMLSDMLGHSSMETTRIYLMTSGEEHVRIMDRMQLVL